LRDCLQSLQEQVLLLESAQIPGCPHDDRAESACGREDLRAAG
jgi:hypothetical protein